LHPPFYDYETKCSQGIEGKSLNATLPPDKAIQDQQENSAADSQQETPRIPTGNRADSH